MVELTTQLLILKNILWLPLCRTNKFGLNTLPSKTVAIPYTCGLSGVVKDVDGDFPPQDGRVVGDDEDDDFPLREGSSPGRIAPLEGKSAPAQVPPQGGGASSRKSSPYFF